MITGSTRLAAVIGDPVRHSLSPVLHNAAYEAADIDVVYVALPVKASDLATFVAFMRTSDMVGASVTMPHKTTVALLCDEVDGNADHLGAVNTLVNTGGCIKGYNTDGIGFVRSLEAAGVAVTGQKIAIIGAGGAARSVALSLRALQPAQLVVANRNRSNAQALVDIVGSPAQVGDMEAVVAADVVVNATPIGMEATIDDSPVPPELLRAGQHVIDLIYHPRQTALLRYAEAAGARTINGVPMLVHQAAAQIELWTGRNAPIDALMAAVQ